MTSEAFQARVEAVVVALERTHDRQHPLRRVPMDLVAGAVADAARVGGAEPCDLTPVQVAEILNVVLARNQSIPNSGLKFTVDPAHLDVVAPWQPSSYQVHDGVERLRDGG